MAKKRKNVDRYANMLSEVKAYKKILKDPRYKNKKEFQYVLNRSSSGTLVSSKIDGKAYYLDLK